jgi:L-glutamine:scyllo-inosose aminotransferase
VNCGRKEPGYDGFPERMLGHNLRMTEWQAAILRAQLERLPEQHTRRAERIARFEREIVEIPGLAPLPPDPRVSFRTAYQLIVRYDRRAFCDVPRDRALEALRAEGVPCSGRFYLPLSDDPLFAADPLTNPATRAGADFSELRFPVSARAAYDEAIWLPHELFLGSDRDVTDLLTAFSRVQDRAATLREDSGSAPTGPTGYALEGARR